jgi:hypothetical protein
MKYVLRCYDQKSPNIIQYWSKNSWRYEPTEKINKARSWKTPNGAKNYLRHLRYLDVGHTYRIPQDIACFVEKVLDKSDFPMAYAIFNTNPFNLVAVFLNDEKEANRKFEAVKRSVGNPGDFRMEEIIANILK